MSTADRPAVTDYPDASEVLDVIYGVGYAASSMVQRKLGLTFRQAEDVLAALGRCGVVGKAKGSAARKILVTRPEAEVILGMDDPEAMASEVPVQDHPRLSVHDVIGALGDLPEGEDSVSVIRKQRDAADRPTVTDNALAAIKARVDAATEGPWHPSTTGVESGDHWSVIQYPAMLPVCRIRSDDGENEHQRRPDAEFIAHARTDVPWLIVEVERLTTRLAAVEALADEWERTEAYRCTNANECPRCLAYQSVVIRLRRAALAAPTDTTEEN